MKRCLGIVGCAGCKTCPCGVGETAISGPSWALDQDIWDRAEKAVLPQGTLYKAPFAVVTHVYKRMGGRIQENRGRLRRS